MTRFHETQAEDKAAELVEYILQEWSDGWCEDCRVRNCPEDFFDDRCPQHDRAQRLSEAVSDFMKIIRRAML